MLPKRLRLNLTKDFQRIASGKRTDTADFTFLVKQSIDGQTRIGVAISKKRGFTKAVSRNTAKRRTMQAIEKFLAVLPKGLEIVIMPKQTMLDRSMEELEKEVKSVQAFNLAD